MATAPEPEEIFARARKEGLRRLSRPPLELAATGLVGGFDVAFGIVAYALTAAEAAPHFGQGVAHLGGSVLALIATTHEVLRNGSGRELERLAEHVAGYGAVTAFASAIVGGALMTLMPWFVEGEAQ